MADEDTIIRDPAGASNQSGLRDLNARVVLSYLRRHTGMPGAEIARRSGLSAQTVSNIIRALEGEGLLMRGKAVKGKVGKPSVPIALNPHGVSSLGLNIGRRSAELVLVDFNGTPIETRKIAYPYPTIEDVYAFLTSGINDIFARHPKAKSRVTGIGVARPNKLWDWLEIVQAPEDAMRKWQDIDFETSISELTGFPVFLENDATSACVAEHLLGRGSEFTDFAYIFVGAFVGGGLVLNSKVSSGHTGNSAQLGSLPVPDGKGGTIELLAVASLNSLERAFIDQGLDPMALRKNADNWSSFEDLVAPWIETTGHHLAFAAASISSVLEVEAILIDGAMPATVRQRLTDTTRAAFDLLAKSIIEKPEIGEATVGKGARSLGAAMLPIHSRFFLA